MDHAVGESSGSGELSVGQNARPEECRFGCGQSG